MPHPAVFSLAFKPTPTYSSHIYAAAAEQQQQQQAMPHINPPSPAMPRLEPPESDQWFARVKGVPFNSENFDCILPGCPNSYQTKQGLERHFRSIHMPKAVTAGKQTRAEPRLPLSPAEMDDIQISIIRRPSSGSRKRIKSHRKGRPPGSGLKARLKQQEIQLALERAIAEEHRIHQQPDAHTNHSLLANHPASARHDYGGDDESKPREERSYLEFFPFLSTSLRLDIVDATPMRSQEGEAEHGKSIKGGEQAVKSTLIAPDVKAEGGEVVMNVDTVTNLSSGTRPLVDNNAHVPAIETCDDSVDPLWRDVSTSSSAQGAPSITGENTADIEEIQHTESINTDLNPKFHPETDADVDAYADATSDPDVFFDAKGFIESEAELNPRSSTLENKDFTGHEAGLRIQEVAGSGIEAEDMYADVEEEIAMTVTVSASASIMSTPSTSPSAPSQAMVVATGGRAATNGVHSGDAVLRHQEEEASAFSHLNSGPRSAKHSTFGQLDVQTLVKAPSAVASSAVILEPKTPMALLPKSSWRRRETNKQGLEEYHLPTGHNVRYIEPTETELAERVEYDMDEQDEFWLKEINAERRKQDLGEVTASMFEKVIDRLEKEWFDLTKNIPKSTENLPPEDSACNICDDGECENSNAIVFCDGCNLAVHQDCYGIPYIPEGQWLCRKCMLSPQMPVSCIFCPGEGGAFKQTTNSRWAHLLCASWIPEVGVANTVYMEPIDNIDKIPASRWRLTCYICKLRMGACIQCETKNCFRAFHVTCARKAHLYMKSKLSKVTSSGGEVLVYRAHCHKHTPRDHKAAVDIAGAAALFAHKGIKKKRTKIRPIDDDSDDPDYGRSDEEMVGNEKGATAVSSLTASQSLGGSRTSKAALAHQKHYTPGAPLAPMFIVNRLLPFVGKLGGKTPTLRKVSALNFIYTVCKYWSLKRESRRGAPLLKRLHLEPWTASASAHRQTEEEKLKKLQTQLLLRGDLEKVRMLAELVRKRERAKLKRQELQNRYLCRIMFPLKTILEDALAELEKLDKQKYFANPILKDEVHDYHEIIKDPICFQTMNEKLVAHQYQTVQDFANDARRIYHNCMTYNDTDTPYYRAASRQLRQADAFLQKAKEDYERLEIDPQTGFLAIPIDPEIFSYSLVSFQKTGDDEQTSTKDLHPEPEAVPVGANSTKPKRRDFSSEPGRTPFVTGRSLRATAGRTVQSVPAPPQQLSQETKSGLNQTTGSRPPARSASRPEAPKLKTATLTRADLAKARQAASDGGAQVELDEEDLLEKLKLKSKKSRSLAVSLQSRLKPSIVDKAVVINKPAPKGWAYVVVEGEEDTTEGEDEADAEVETESNSTALDAEAQELARAKEELSLRRKEERIAEVLKKKLAKEKKSKFRAEKYALFKAKAASGAAPDLLHQSSSGARASETAQESAHSKARPRRAQARQRSKETVDLHTGQDGQESVGSIFGALDASEFHPTEELTETNDQNHFDNKLPPSLARDEGPASHDSCVRAPSPATRSSRGKGKQVDRERDSISEQFEDLYVRGGDADGKENSGGLQGGPDILVEDEELPRKRQKRTGNARGTARDAPEDESATINTRRLRSTEVVPPVPPSLGSRRGSSGSHRGAARGVGDTVETSRQAAKRRRSESSEGSPKKQKSDRQGGIISHGSLVWAKMEGFPWFPAELMDPKRSTVPELVTEMKREGPGVHLVQFFDLRERGERGRSWYWMTAAQILPLGVDLDEDRKRVHLKAGWNPKRRKTVKQAYADACQSKGVDARAVLADVA